MGTASVAARAMVQAELDALVEGGEETGLQVAAYQRGELALDLWAGWADRASGRKVDGDTLFTGFSMSKGVTATCIHLLAERGLLDYDAPITRYWPAFGQQGKERTTVRHALTHTAAVPQMPPGLAPEALTDWSHMTALVANQQPLWLPGEQTAYHGYTMGWILGEVLRGADGRPIARFLQEEICAPLGLDGIHFGVSGPLLNRVATLEHDPTYLFSGPRGSFWDLAHPFLRDAPSVFNRAAIRAAVQPAAGGIMNARSLAKHYAALLPEGADGVRLLPAERLAIATALQTQAWDPILVGETPKALGYMRGGAGSPMPPDAFGHGGFGGTIAFADPARGMAVAITKNRLRGYADPEQAAAHRLVRAVYRALEGGH